MTEQVDGERLIVRTWQLSHKEQVCILGLDEEDRQSAVDVSAADHTVPERAHRRAKDCSWRSWWSSGTTLLTELTTDRPKLHTCQRS